MGSRTLRRCPVGSHEQQLSIVQFDLAVDGVSWGTFEVHVAMLTFDHLDLVSSVYGHPWPSDVVRFGRKVNAWTRTGSTEPVGGQAVPSRGLRSAPP